jgi:hypothetical protein
MSDEIAKRVATNELSARGYRVDPIPEDKTKTADLLVTGRTSKYLIEAKDRRENPEVNERRQEHFAAGKMFIDFDPVAYDTNICSTLRDAQEQLNETPNESGSFKLIWFHSPSLSPDHKYRRLFKTFYGHEWLIPPREHGNESVHCLYFGFNLSYELRDVEALILTQNGEMQICLNEFAKRIDEFRNSELCQTYLQLGAVFDPKSAVENGEFIACTAEMSRKVPDAVLNALEAQTGIRYRVSPTLQHHTFEIGRNGSEFPDELNIAQ